MIGYVIMVSAGQQMVVMFYIDAYFNCSFKIVDCTKCQIKYFKNQTPIELTVWCYPEIPFLFFKIVRPVLVVFCLR